MSRDNSATMTPNAPPLVSSEVERRTACLDSASRLRSILARHRRLGGDQNQAGFTLLEMLVALAVFSIAALALLNLETVTVTNTNRIADRTFGQIVAHNIAVETLTDPAPPSLGTATGEEVNGGRNWQWTRVTGPSPEARILQIDIAVADEFGDHAADLTIFRFAAL